MQAMAKNIKIIVAATLVTAISISAMARPAYRGTIVKTQPDGSTIEVTLHGDEFYHWMTSNGTYVAMDIDGFIRPATEDPAVRESARRRAASMRESRQRSYSPRLASSAEPSRSLVILVDFTDLKFIEEEPNTAFSNLLNERGYSVNGSIGSAYDYFYENSHGQFNTEFDVYGPVEVGHEMSFYGENDRSGNDKQPVMALVEACRILDEEVDFSRYDSDGDGVVDDVFFFYAGYNEAEGGPSASIWPHEWDVYSALYYSGNYRESFEFDGVELGSYACSSEFFGSWGENMTGIGAFCHEYGHVLGLPDFYDTDYEDNGLAMDMSFFSLMASGCDNSNGRIPPYLSTIEKEILGWMEMPGLLTEPGSYTIGPVQENAAWRLPTDVDNEYYVLECRNNEGWDSGLGSAGMLIYHVDKSSNKVAGKSASSYWKNWQSSNSINAYSSHPLCCVVASNSRYNSPTALGSASKYLFPGSSNATAFDSTTNPSSTGWSGKVSGHNLSDISYSKGAVTFTYSYIPFTFDALGERGFNAIDNPGEGQYLKNKVFKFALKESNRPPKTVKWYFDNTPKSTDQVTLTAGEHVVSAVLTYDDGSVEVLELKIDVKAK